MSQLLPVAGSAAGILICALWGLTAHSYSKIYRAKLQVIRELEKRLSYPCYADELARLKALGFTPVSRYEKLASILMALLFIAIMAATIRF
ncbi:MAG TPA: hypothetical protein VF006_18755 [Longimicrobium sp.]